MSSSSSSIAASQVNTPDEERLIEAVYRNDLAAVQELVDRGVDVKIKDYDLLVDETLLETACFDKADLEIVRLLVAAGALTDTSLPLYRYIPYASETAEVLLENGLDVDTSNEEGFTSLHFAAEEGDAAFAEFLLHHGANVNVEDANGRTPLSYAIEERNTDVAIVLIENGGTAHFGNGRTLLHETSISGYFPLAQWLIQNRDFDANVRDNIGMTPLVCACQTQRLTVVKFLVRNGADINARDDEGCTALHWACRLDHFSIVEWLVSYVGSEIMTDCNVQDNEGRTALHVACWEGHHWCMVKSLIDHGANVNATAGDGKTPLHAASERGNLEVVQYLCNRGANPNAKTVAGCSPLHLAAEGNHANVVWFLMRHQLDPHEVLQL